MNSVELLKYASPRIINLNGSYCARFNNTSDPLLIFDDWQFLTVFYLSEYIKLKYNERIIFESSGKFVRRLYQSLIDGREDGDALVELRRVTRDDVVLKIWHVKIRQRQATPKGLLVNCLLPID